MDRGGIKRRVQELVGRYLKLDIVLIVLVICTVSPKPQTGWLLERAPWLWNDGWLSLLVVLWVWGRDATRS